MADVGGLATRKSRHSGERLSGRTRMSERDATALDDFSMMTADCGSLEADACGDRAAANQSRSLVETIEGEVIPRLMLAHRLPSYHPAAGSASGKPSAEEVEAFTRLVVGRGRQAARRRIEELRGEGYALGSIFLDLLAPVARRLGAMWESDELTFADVTMGLSCLQQLLREFGPTFEREEEGGADGRRIALAVVPGEQHTFGTFILEEFFRRDGWEVWCSGSASQEVLLGLVADEFFPVIGLSLSWEGLIDDLASLIGAIRKASRNPDIVVMVGGYVFDGRPELVSSVGADFVARDCREAVELVNHKLELIAAR